MVEDEFSPAFSLAFDPNVISIPGYAGCPWPVDPACMTEEWEALDPSVQERSLALASSTLHRLTGYRVGGCPVTVRPCKRSCTDFNYSASYLNMQGYGGSGFNPHIAESGAWVNSCGCHTDCACESVCEIALPGPVGEVQQVKLDGVVLDPFQYRVDGNSVVWVDQAMECPWPACQDMTLPDSEEGTFSITYLNSFPVDALGAYAVGILAMEYAKACTSGKCKLPTGVTSIVRQGVSYDIASGAFPNGLTGLREVDAFIAIWNPGRLRQATGVWFPGKRAPRVVPS